MKPRSEKQRQVLEYLHTHDEITTDDTIELLGRYYYNTRKHTGDVLARMVKAGLLERVKPGRFKLGKVVKPKHDPNQVELFGETQ